MKGIGTKFIRVGMCILGFVMTILVVLVELVSLNDSGNKVLGVKQEETYSQIGLGEIEERMEVEETVRADDARILLVKRYLERYKSPLLPYSQLIVELSDTYGFDYRWMVAIAQQESNLCKKIPAESHNCWGYGIYAKGTLRFENYDLALRSFASYLQKSYFDKGLDTAELMMTKYCPHSNGSWAYGINQFFDDIEAGK